MGSAADMEHSAVVHGGCADEATHLAPTLILATCLLITSCPASSMFPPGRRRGKRGKTVVVTGAVARGGPGARGLNWCFTSTPLKVCSK